ncbi:MAG: hypothetical protein LBM06_08140 [Prevotellaceae bacterium]|nr:hypothetical protein [Prevotellaceae bacterium]
MHLEASYSNTFGRMRGGGYLPLMPAQRLNAVVSAAFVGKRVLRKYSFYLQHRMVFAQHCNAYLHQ